jgi:peptide/nickel transport system substrate-binding protein
LNNILFSKKALTRIQGIIIAMIVIVAAIVGVAYYYVSQPPSPSPSPPLQTSELHYGWVTDLTTVDPGVGWSTDALMIIRVCYDRLVQLNGSSLDIVPSLATDWAISPDGLTYTFNLRQGVKFDDGTPFDATAVKRSFERQLGIGQQSQNFIALNNVEVVNASTVAFHLKTPFAPLLGALATCAGSIINPNALDAHKTADDPWALSWFEDHTNGTGPYMLKEWQKGDHWILVQNPNYWGGWDGPHLSKITGTIITEPATTRMMVQKGDLDISFFISREDIPELQMDPNIKIVEYPALSTLYLCLNNAKGPLSDVHVRRALSWAFDYTSVLSLILFHGHQGRGSMPAAMWASVGSDNTQIFQYQRNITKAQEELAQSAYPNGGFTLQYLWCAGVDEERKIGELLQANLRELNINVQIVEQTWATLTQTTTNPDTAMDIVCLFEFGFAPDPHFMMYDRFHSSRIPPRGYNWNYFNSTEVSSLLDQAVLTTDVSQRASLYHQADNILIDQAVSIWAYEETKIVTMGAWVHGFTPNPCWVETYNFYDMYVVDSEKP